MLKFKPLLFLSFYCLFHIGKAAGEHDTESLETAESTNNWPDADVRPYSFVFQATTPENYYKNLLLQVAGSEEHEHLTLKVLKRLGVPLPEDMNNLDRPLTIHDLKVLGFNLPKAIRVLNDTLTIDEFRKLGAPWFPKRVGSDRHVTAEDLKSLGYDWMKDLFLLKEKNLVFSDLKKLGYPLPPDVNLLQELKMEDLEALSKKLPLPSELYGIRTLSDVRRVIEKAERPLIEMIVTLGIIDSLALTSGRKRNDEKQFDITEPNCKYKKEFKRDCIGNVSSYCQYDMSRYVLPTPLKIKNWCCGINEKINCAMKWLNSCDSLIETLDYTNGKTFIMSHFCNNNVKLQSYSELGPCHERLRPEWNYCYREFEKHLITLYDMINYNELDPKDTVNFSCARARFRGCVMQILDKESKMFESNNSYCTPDNVDALKEFTLVFSNGLSFKSCDGFYVSSCQYMDGPFSLTMERLEYNAADILSANSQITFKICVALIYCFVSVFVYV